MTSQQTHRLFRPESVSRALSFYIPATALARILGLVRGVLLARLLSEHEFGLFQVTLLVVNVLNPLCGLGMNEGVARYVPMYETRGVLRTYLRRVVPFIAAVALILSAVVFVSAQPLGRVIFATLPKSGLSAVEPETWTALTRVAAGVTFGTVMYFLILAVLKGMRMFRAISLLELLNNLLFTILTVSVALAGWKSAGAMMVCYGATLVAVMLLFVVPTARATGYSSALSGEYQPASEAHADAMHLAAAPDEASLIPKLVKFSSWAALAAVVWQLLQYYPMWFLQKTHGPSATAVFGGVRLITQVVMVGAVTVIAVVQTWVTKMWEAKGSAEADRSLLLIYKTTSLLLLVGCVVFALLADPIMRLFPPSFAIGVPIVPLSLLFFLISSHLTFLSIHFALIEKMRHLFLPWTLGLACNVLFAVLLVSPYEPPADALMGAAWAGALGMSAAMVAAILLVRLEKRPIDVGTLVFWASIYILALPPIAAAGVVLLILVVSYTSGWIFTPGEKQELRYHLRHGLWQLPGLLRQGSDGAGGGK